MSGCVLRVHGNDFDARRFIDGSRLKAVRLEASAFNVVVSERGADDLRGQIADAIAFVDAHSEELQRLKQHLGAEVCLDFGIAQTEVAAQFVSFPPELVRKAAEIGAGLEVSLYAYESEGS